MRFGYPAKRDVCRVRAWSSWTCDSDSAAPTANELKFFLQRLQAPLLSGLVCAAQRHPLSHCAQAVSSALAPAITQKSILTQHQTLGSARQLTMAAAAKAKARDSLAETAGGEFKRKDSVFRDWVEEGGKYPPEAGRYTLYISYACPWANRCLAFRNIKGLEGAIDVSVVHPTWQRTRPDDPEDTHSGWTFADPSDPPFQSQTGYGSFPCTDCVPDPNIGAKYIRDLYDAVDDTNGKYTVPVLWDKKTKSIVNNESADILRILNSHFNGVSKKPEVDLYPEALQSKIDELNEWIYPQINNGVYRCGFAQSQKPYETAFKELFAALDRVEDILSEHRYLAGDQLTEADVRLFMTLIRFDEVYVVYFKCNRNFIHEMPNTMNFVRELYQMPGIHESINMYHIKTHYLSSHPKLNYYAIVPLGGESWWEQPHDREEKFPAK